MKYCSAFLLAALVILTMTTSINAKPRSFHQLVDAYFDDYKATLDRQYEEWKTSPEGRRGPTKEELLRRLAERGHTIKVDLGPEFDRPI